MSSLLTETFEGVPGGMNLAMPQWELDDSECRYLQDALVDYPGIVRRRGPVGGVSGVAALTRKGSGLIMTLNPIGVDKYAVLNGDNSNGFFSVLDDSLTTINADIAWPHVLPTNPPSQPYRIVDAKPVVLGGVWVGVSSSYDANSPSQGLALWMGGNKANYAAPSITVARSSSAVTAPSGFNANVAPGMWVFGATDEGYTNALIGLVRTVNSDTSITLTAGSPYNVTAKAATIQSLRGFAPKVVKGHITCDTNSTTITGGATKFQSQGLATGTWQIYRSIDMAFVGKVLSVASEYSVTLTANAAVACADAAYTAIRVDSDYTIPTTTTTAKVGWITASYADRQWYANNGAQFEKTSRVWFSDPADPEAVDISTFDGDWLDVTSSSTVNEPIRALQAAYSGLLVFKENETFLISGSSPSNFSVRKLEDDGAVSGMSVQAYGGGVIWAGREGIHFFDGIQTTNMTAQKFGDYWKNTIRTFDTASYRMWSMINRDHYLLFIENIAPTVAVVKGTTSVTPTRYTVCINLTTRAFSILTNVNMRGAVVLPGSAGKSVWYLANDATIGHICNGEFLFNAEGVDAFACDGGTAGPDFFMETKKFFAGDSLRLKRFKQFEMEYLVQGAAIKLDTVVGLNNIGATLTSVFQSSVLSWSQLATLNATWNALRNNFPTWNDIVQGVFLPKRIRFMKKNQFLSFRMWQENASVVRLRLGPYGIAYKLQRPGRV